LHLYRLVVVVVVVFAALEQLGFMPIRHRRQRASQASGDPSTNQSPPYDKQNRLKPSKNMSAPSHSNHNTTYNHHNSHSEETRPRALKSILQRKHKSKQNKKYWIIGTMVALATAAAIVLAVWFTSPSRHHHESASNSNTTIANSLSNNPKEKDFSASQANTKDTEHFSTMTPSKSPSSSPTATLRPTAAMRNLVTQFGSFEVLEVVPHDAESYTQGLELWNDTIMLEGSGLYGGKSSLRMVHIPTGTVLQHHSLESTYFGEGVTLFPCDNFTSFGIVNNASLSYNIKINNCIIQLTWREKTGFLYPIDQWDKVQPFTYTTTTGDGWGIAYHPQRHVLYVSDGSQYIHIWDPSTLQTTSKRAVQYQWPSTTTGHAPRSQSAYYLNELEWDVHSATLLANVYQQDVILRIDVDSGNVMRMYNLRSLYVNRTTEADVLNGIAITNTPNILWVTGKLWPYMYKIRLLDT
jgi:glutamine cyclotransferase